MITIICFVGLFGGCGDTDDAGRRGVLPKDGEADVVSEEDVEVTLSEKDIAGMYLAENGSIIMLHTDGTADYYRFGEEEISADNNWKYQNGSVNIELASIHCKISGEIIGDGEILLEADSALWENATYKRIDDEKESITTSDCDKIIEEQLGLEKQLEFVEIEYDGIKYNMPSYLEFYGEEEDKTTIYASQDEMYAIAMMSGYIGSTVSSKVLRESLVENFELDSLENEGEIKVAGYSAYYVEFSGNVSSDVISSEQDLGSYGKGVLVFIQHNGNLDMFICLDNDVNSERDYLSDIYNMFGTAVVADSTNSGTESTLIAGNVTENINDLYRITNTYFYPCTNALGYAEFYGVVEIENTSNSNLLLKSCIFDLEDNDGHLLHTEDYIQCAPKIIPPGEKGYFYNNEFGATVNNGISSSNGVILKPSITVEKTNSHFYGYSVSDVSTSWGITGFPEFTGRVTNDTSLNANRVVIYAFIMDSNDQVIGIDYTYVDDLESGQTKSFSFGALTGRSPEVKNAEGYRLIATSEELGW